MADNANTPGADNPECRHGWLRRECGVCKASSHNAECTCCGRRFYSYDGSGTCAYCIMDSVGARRAGLVHDASSHAVRGSALVAPAWRVRAASGDGAGARDYSGQLAPVGGYDA